MEEEDFSPREKFTCEHCHAEFNKKKNLQQHIQRMKNPQTGIMKCERGTLVCETCRKTFRRQSELNKHIKSGKGKCPTEKEYSCLRCHKIYKYHSAYARHMNLCGELEVPDQEYDEDMPMLELSDFDRRLENDTRIDEKVQKKEKKKEVQEQFAQELAKLRLSNEKNIRELKQEQVALMQTAVQAAVQATMQAALQVIPQIASNSQALMATPAAPVSQTNQMAQQIQNIQQNQHIENIYGNKFVNYLSFGDKPLLASKEYEINNQMIMKALEGGTAHIVPYITRLLHCNPDLPENHNIYKTAEGKLMGRKVDAQGVSHWEPLPPQVVYPRLFQETEEVIQKADSDLCDEVGDAVMTPDQIEDFGQIRNMNSKEQKVIIHTRSKFIEKIDPVLRACEAYVV